MKKKMRQKGWWWKVEENRTDVPFAILIKTQRNLKPDPINCSLYPLFSIHVHESIKTTPTFFLLSHAYILEKLWIR